MKTILLGLMLMPFFGFTQTGNVTGVITYFFNDNFGNKPDIGAKVFVFKEESINGKAIDSFVMAKTYRHFHKEKLLMYGGYQQLVLLTARKKSDKVDHEKYLEREAAAKKEVDAYYQKLVKLGVETDAKFDSLDIHTSFMISDATQSNPIETVVDGAGNFNAKVKPGTYYVLLKSSGRQGDNVTEILGKVYGKKVVVADEETKNVSYNFDLY